MTGVRLMVADGGTTTSTGAGQADQGCGSAHEARGIGTRCGGVSAQPREANRTGLASRSSGLGAWLGKACRRGRGGLGCEQDSGHQLAVDGAVDCSRDKLTRVQWLGSGLRQGSIIDQNSWASSLEIRRRSKLHGRYRRDSSRDSQSMSAAAGGCWTWCRRLGKLLNHRSGQGSQTRTLQRYGGTAATMVGSRGSSHGGLAGIGPWSWETRPELLFSLPLFSFLCFL